MQYNNIAMNKKNVILIVVSLSDGHKPKKFSSDFVLQK